MGKVSFGDQPNPNSSSAKLKPRITLWDKFTRLLPRTVRGTLILLLLVAFVPREIIEISHYINLFQERRNHEYQANLELARSMGATIEAYIRDILRQEFLTGIALTSPQPQSLEQVQRLLASSAQEYPSIRDYGWVDRQGRILASIEPRAVGRDISDRSYFTEIAAGREWTVSNLMQGRFTGETSFFISRGIRDEAGVLQGVVVAALDPARLGEVLKIQRTGEASAGIMDRQGRLVYRYPEVSLSWDKRDVLAAQPFIAPVLAGKNVVGTFNTLPDGRSRISSYAPIGAFGWIAGSGRPESEAMAAVYQELFRESSQELGLAVVAFFLAFLIGRAVSKPVKSLTEHTLAFGRGEVSHLAEITRPIEMKQLAFAFDQMSRAVNRRTYELELMLDTVRAASGEGDLDILLNEMARLLARAVNVSICRVALLANGESDLVLRAEFSAFPSNPHPGIGIAYPVDQVPLAKLVVERKQAIELKDLDSECQAGAEREHWLSSGLKVVLGLPLLTQDKVIGVVIVGEVTPREFGEDEKRLCIGIAQQFGLAVEKAILDRQMAGERERSKAIIENTSDGIVVMDADRKIVTMNPSMEALSGWTWEEVQGRHCWEVFQSRDGDGISVCDTACPMLKTMEAGNAVPYAEVTITTKDGQSRAMSASYVYIDLPSNGPGYCVAICRDISKMKEVEKLKDEFVSLLSHDLRNPLSIILGRAQLMARVGKKAGWNSSTLENAEAIVTSAQRIAVMISDLVDSTRLESGRLVLEKQQLDFKSCLSEFLERMTGVMETSRINPRIPSDLPRVLADPDLLERILANLLSNALKYSPPETEVLVEAKRTNEGLVISIADRGVGIAPQDLPHIFDRYYRVKSAHKVEGLGLGLYITKILVETHGGSIWVESHEGEGSTFCFTIPVAQLVAQEV